MTINFFLSMMMSVIMALLSMAFYTLLERKLLGYMQTRKGPNKVSITGAPQPLADAMKLLLKEQNIPSSANMAPFLAAPIMGLILAMILWTFYPHQFSSFHISFSILMFLAISSLSVYTTLGAGWTSNSKYALLGALRSVAQTISYEISMALILISPLILLLYFSFFKLNYSSLTPIYIILPLSLFIWFTTSLAETNRTPFDLAEGESELVSGFNTEYSAGEFALIFMAEYMNILVISLFTVIIFSSAMINMIFLSPVWLMLKTLFISALFVWARATLPRMRYDRLMNLTWKTFLPFSIIIMLLTSSITFFIF